ADGGYPQLSSVPRHVRVIPRQPRKAFSIRTDSRIRVKVLSLDQNVLRRQSVVRHRGDGIDHDSVGSAVVFPHTNQSVSRGIRNSIRISALGSLTYRTWRPVLILPV